MNKINSFSSLFFCCMSPSSTTIFQPLNLAAENPTNLTWYQSSYADAGTRSVSLNYCLLLQMPSVIKPLDPCRENLLEGNLFVDAQPIDHMEKQEATVKGEPSTTSVVEIPPPSVMKSSGLHKTTRDRWFSKLPVVASRSQFSGHNIHLWAHHIQSIPRPRKLSNQPIPEDGP